MGIRILKFTNFIENALCIYRNVCLYSVWMQALISLRVVTELVFIFAHIVTRTQFFYSHPQCNSDIMYFYLTSVNSIVIIVFGFCYTKSYRHLIIHLNSGCKFFDNDKNYLNSLRAKHLIVVGCVFGFCLIKVVVFAYAHSTWVLIPDLHLIWYRLFQINMLMSDFRYIFEYLVLYCVLHVIAEQLKSVTRSINCDSETGNDSNTLITEVDRWSVIYKHARESAKLFNYIFGIQLTIMLATAMFYYIIFLYTMASQSVAGRSTLKDTIVYLTTLALMLCILYMLSRAAQRMENSADVLRRRLCKLLVLSQPSDDYHKATKDLLRMMSTRPIRARAFGCINVDMTLLPACVSFFTSYTVIALQFNNVV
ncbi:uncharacterized protein LOC135074825 [Ostrinia nubilalis]|uniref:uncharacterized protein LOC135074825 n=1 Tax=Ostrinia nubilalis TaxID=29057 RepID=UPI0030824C03